MAKFRRSNIRHGRRSSKAWLPRIVSIILICLFAIGFIARKGMRLVKGDDYSMSKVETEDGRFYLPKGGDGQLIHHTHYSLSYNEKWEQAEWVAYTLTKGELSGKRVKREKRFRPDYDVRTRSAYHRDYTNSGFTRGHLAPAGDMSFDKVAMEESFYMSNMSPQTRPFNNGIWRELEETTRDWARSKGELVIVSGPLFHDKSYDVIGDNRVAVPHAFFKILLYKRDGKAGESIAFNIPHETSEKHLENYIVSINEIEELVGLNFFDDLFDDESEEEFESKTKLGHWKFDSSKFNQRVKYWNSQ